MTIFNSCTY